MRITYRQLFAIAQAVFTEEQWDSDVTVEDGINEECFAAELRIADEHHDSLDNEHPVIFFGEEENSNRATQKEVEDYIVSLNRSILAKQMNQI
jgi:hypothetical protein